MAHLGFVGLGAMGSRIAKRLLDAGHRVTGYNRTAVSPEVSHLNRASAPPSPAERVVAGARTEGRGR
ncbi:MAG: NAD(P)-binding domain-containing protein [bacterium]